MLPVTILHQAELELWDTAKYYESKSASLGADFLAEMEEAVLFIQEAPFRQAEGLCLLPEEDSSSVFVAEVGGKELEPHCSAAWKSGR